MTFITFIWAFSLVVMLLLAGYAYYLSSQKKHHVVAHLVPLDLHTFIHEALVHMFDGVLVVLQHTKPHTDRALLYVKRVSKLGHDKFIDRVFGKTEQHRGKTASFFLKYIAEHKEEHRGTPEQRAGY
jgi:hypothetical protein